MQRDVEISIILFDEHGCEININDAKRGADYINLTSLTPSLKKVFYFSVFISVRHTILLKQDKLCDTLENSVHLHLSDRLKK